MNRKLLRSVREYKRESFLTPVLVCLEVLMEVLIPLLMANIIDVGIANGDMGYIIRTGVLLIVMAMLALVFGAKAGQMGAIASSGYAKNLRHDIFYKIQDFSFGNIDHFSTSSLVTRMTTDITNVQMAYMFTIRPVIDHDADDQRKDCGHHADHGADPRRCADRDRKDGTPAFRTGI